MQLWNGKMQYYNTTLPPLSIYLKLVPKKDREFFLSYLKWIKLLSIRGIGQKKCNYKFFSNIYQGVQRNWSENYLLGNLQKEFIKRNISLSILLEPIDGFSWFIKNRYELEYTKSFPLLMPIISPISRLIAVLNNNSPIFYQPFSNLVLAYFSLYVKENRELQKIFKNNKILFNIKELDKQNITLFNEAKYILPTSKGLLFKLKLGFYIGLLKIIIEKKSEKIKKSDYVNSFLYGLHYIMTIRSKKMKIKQNII